MRIGRVKLKNPVIAAPMAGITNRTYRVLAREAGCGLVCTEMVSDQAILYSNPRTFRMLNMAGEARPVSVQLFGSNPATMARAAIIVEELGADIIDINMGCPTPKIVKNGEGAALMKDPVLAAEIVAAVVSRVEAPVTVKMRKGWDDASVNAVKLAQLVERAGASAVTVHGRTRMQLYSGRADWSIIGAVKKAVAIPVIGNGDIFGPQDALRMIRETGCDGVMIGRAALGNPWLFTQTAHYLATAELLPAPDPVTKAAMALRHLDLLVEEKGEEAAVREMRKHAAWYLKGLREAARMRDVINRVRSRVEMVESLKKFLNLLAVLVNPC
ncbi:MAG: tRNA dihydrouridine synthase DusB [Peptococcaceae bacterium]|nr:MAG: tRNA dihydrouridine synthase DusB [Peptococcaceae bacterium]